MYEIEKDVPIPEMLIKRKYPVPFMEIGDSFIIPKDDLPKNSNIGGRVFPQAKRLGYRLTTRKLSDGSYRVWRIE
jgi:hypothetical protein